MIRRVARNTLFLSASQLIARLIGFFYFIFLARALGVANFGIYTFTLYFIYNFIPVADFGLERFVLRDISREPGKTPSYFQRLIPLRIFLGFFAYLFSLLLGVILDLSGRQIFYLAIFGLLLIPYNIVYFIASFQNAKEKMEYMAMANVALIFLTAALGIVFVWRGLSLAWVLTAYPMSAALVTAFFLYRLKKWDFPLDWSVDLQFWKKAISESWVFAALIILAVFYLRVTIIVVGLIESEYLTGLYGSAFKFVDALISIPQALALALFPISSRLFLNNKEKLMIIYKKGLAILLLASLPFAFVLAVFPKLIIRFSYGESYLPSSTVYPVLGLALVLFFLNVLPGNVIQNSAKVKNFLPLAVLNFLIAFLLCLILIPRYSLMGAAWAVVGGEVAGLIINNYFVYRILNEKT